MGAELLNGDIEGEGLGAVAVHVNNATARAGFPTFPNLPLLRVLLPALPDF